MNHYAYYERKKAKGLFDTWEKYEKIRERRAEVYMLHWGRAMRHLVGWDLHYPELFNVKVG